MANNSSLDFDIPEDLPVIQDTVSIDSRGEITDRPTSSSVPTHPYEIEGGWDTDEDDEPKDKEIIVQRIGPPSSIPEEEMNSSLSQTVASYFKKNATWAVPTAERAYKEEFVGEDIERKEMEEPE